VPLRRPDWSEFAPSRKAPPRHIDWAMPRMRRAVAPMMHMAKFGTSSTKKRKAR
jgi:hypothetical protein